MWWNSRICPGGRSIILKNMLFNQAGGCEDQNWTKQWHETDLISLRFKTFYKSARHWICNLQDTLGPPEFAADYWAAWCWLEICWSPDRWAMDFLAGKSVANDFRTCSDHGCCQIRKPHVEMILIVHQSGQTSRKFHAVFIFVFITTPLRFSLELLLDKLKFRDFIRFTRCHLKPYRDHLLLDRQPWSCQP